MSANGHPTNLDIGYDSFEDLSTNTLEATLKDLDSIVSQYIQQDDDSDLKREGRALHEYGETELFETSLQDLHSILLSGMRTCIETIFHSKGDMVRICSELSKIVLAFSLKLSDNASLALSTILAYHENAVASALMEEALKNSHMIQDIQHTFQELVESSMRHSQATKSVIGNSIKQYWNTEKTCITVLQEKMASFSQKCQHVSEKIQEMKETNRSKDEEMHSLILSLETVRKHMASQSEIESRLQLEYKSKTLEAKELSDRTSNLQERQQKARAQLVQQTQWQDNQLHQLLQYKKEALEALVQRLEMAVSNLHGEDWPVMTGDV